MYINNLKRLRTEKELTQEDISSKLKCKRTTYNNWERGIVMIPLDKADEMSLFYNVRLSYILGLDKSSTNDYKIKKLNKAKLLENLSKLKKDNHNTYEEIATYLKCNRSTCSRYFKGVFDIPIDRLILLAELYNIDLDKLCGKE